MSTSKNARERLGKLVEWHRRQAKRAGISRNMEKFHEDSAKCVDAFMATVKDDALAFIDAADELYSAFTSKRGSQKWRQLDTRQQSTLDDFAKASNAWAQHPRKCS